MSAGTNHISVVIAAMNAEATIARAVMSALGEELVAEVVLVDDGSQDATVAMARAADDASGRLKILALDRNRGPAAARNRAFDLCTSPYVALLDADDFFLPGRVARLLASMRGGWDLLADDILIVPEHLQGEELTLPDRARSSAPVAIDLETFLSGNICRRGRPRGELGFLKPIFRLGFLKEHALRYEEDLRLGEDYALYCRALMAGARFFMAAACGYVAIEREHSISSCHSADDLEKLFQFDARCLASAALTRGERNALKAHHAATIKRAVYARALEVRRKQGMGAALGVVARQPSTMPYIVIETMRAKGATLLGRPGQSGPKRGVRLLGVPELGANRAR